MTNEPEVKIRPFLDTLLVLNDKIEYSFMQNVILNCQEVNSKLAFLFEHSLK